MRLGIAGAFTHTSPDQWAQKHREAGLRTVVFPCSYRDSTAKIDEYVMACRNYDLKVAEVGAWKNLLSPDAVERKRNFDYCIHQLELADYVGADCCVNISGAKGEIWDGAYAENYSEETYCEIVTGIQSLIDRVKPKNTFYTLEPMPWMHPDSPEDYLQMIKDINRERFAVHMDIINMINTPQKYLFCRHFTDNAFSVLGKYIKSCHIKDVVLDTKLTTRLSETIPGEGGFDIKNYIDRAEEINPDMTMIIEHLGSECDYMKAINHIKSIMEEKK